MGICKCKFYEVQNLLFVVYRGLGDEKFEVPWSATTAKRNEKFVLVTNPSGMVKFVFVVWKVIKVDNMWVTLIYNLCRLVNMSNPRFAIGFTDKNIACLLYVVSDKIWVPAGFEPVTSPPGLSDQWSTERLAMNYDQLRKNSKLAMESNSARCF